MLPVDLQLTVEDFYHGECAAFPARLDTPRNCPDTGPNRNDAPFRMNAEHAARHLYHYMKDHIPGFAALNGTKGYGGLDEFWKRFVIHVPYWGAIAFWNFGGKMQAEDGAVLRIIRSVGNNTLLIAEPLKRQKPQPGPYATHDICYEGDEDEAHVGFNLPKRPETVDNIITVFAVVHAIGRLAPAWKDPRGEERLN
jgi:hypothetical protein